MKEKAQKFTKLYFEILTSINPPSDQQFEDFRTCLEEIVVELEKIYPSASDIEDQNPNQQLSDLFSVLPVSVQFTMLRAYLNGTAQNMLIVENAQKAFLGKGTGGIFDMIADLLGIKKPKPEKD